MGSWLTFNFFIGLVLIAIGILYRYRTPRFGSRNAGVIYRFARRNAEIWKETHRYIAVLLVMLGALVLLVAASPFLFGGEVDRMVPGGMVIGGSVLVFLLTRRHIDNVFDDLGNRRL